MPPVSAPDYLVLRSGTLPLQSVPAAANGNIPYVCLLIIKNFNVPVILGMDTLAKFGSFGIDWAHQTLTLSDAKLI